MNRSKTCGYITVILILTIALISTSISILTLNTIKDTRIIDNSIDGLQSKYISESYLLMEINRKTYGSDFYPKILFPDLKYEKKIENVEKNLGIMPCEQITVTSSYKGIESRASGLISKFNKIFYIEDRDVIAGADLQGSELEAFKYFKNKFIHEKRYTSELPLVTLDDDKVIASISLTQPWILQKTDDKLLMLENVLKQRHFEILGNIDVGNGIYKGGVILNGSFYLEGSLNLYTDLILNGIVISNSGKIETNGYNCRINGILIELGSDGSFSNINIYKHLGLINTYIKYLDCAKYHELLSFKINDDFAY